MVVVWTVILGGCGLLWLLAACGVLERVAG
jgi:hypothetical protein